MFDIDTVRAALKKAHLGKLEVKIGVHYNTLLGIRNGTNKNPTLKTLTAISNWMAASHKDKK